MKEILYLLFLLCIYVPTEIKKPNIVLIIADDLGWNDVGFHGSNQIPTPNIDALAYNGMIFDRFYTQPACTPSRAALLTGQYPIRLGFQGIPLIAGENRYLPFNVKTLPEKLRDLGYRTALIGKWHLGSAYKNVTPTAKGFDYHFGYWHGYIGYFNHEAYGQGMHGLDMHENLQSSWSTQNEYVTRLFSKKVEEMILKHDESQPLFLTITHLAPHTGNKGVDLEVPNIEKNERKFQYIKNKKRRLYAGMVNELDESVGRVVQSLAKKNILDNTIIIFFSDNGAQTIGIHQNWGSNWPLRGMKFTVLEGGVRNVAVMYYSKLPVKGVINRNLFHITDFLPTLYAAAGGNVEALGKIDGVNQWDTLIYGKVSKRSSILLNIDEVNNSSALIGEQGRYKLINGSSVFEGYDGFFGDDGHNNQNLMYDINSVLCSLTNLALGNKLTEESILTLRRNSSSENCRSANESTESCEHRMCLFDIIKDPCETNNLITKYPNIVMKLSKSLQKYRKNLMPQTLVDVDPRANPIYFNNSWATWLDYNN